MPDAFVLWNSPVLAGGGEVGWGTRYALASVFDSSPMTCLGGCRSGLADGCNGALGALKAIRP